MKKNKLPVSSVMTRTAVCVDNYENSVVKGFVCSQITESALPFYGITELFKILDSILDMLAFPQKSLDYRKFSRSAEEEIKTEIQLFNDEKSLLSQQGKLATFIIQIQFRQNATWQGAISWLNHKKKQNFRSALELLKLLDDAMTVTTCTDDSSAVNWDTEENDD